MYRYTLSVTPADGHAKTAGQGVVEVRHGKSRRIQQDIVLPDATGRVNLQITIDYQGIHFGSDTPSMQRQTISHWIRLPELQHDKVTL